MNADGNPPGGLASGSFGLSRGSVLKPFEPQTALCSSQKMARTCDPRGVRTLRPMSHESSYNDARPAPSRGSTGQGGRVHTCPHAQPGCPTRGAPPSAPARQLHVLTNVGLSGGGVLGGGRHDAADDGVRACACGAGVLSGAKRRAGGPAGSPGLRGGDVGRARRLYATAPPLPCMGSGGVP